ncbi:hypothetical protein EDC96DRAFT_560674 [Choanephora cucurbitarum]|nr:hypothetical protein EDC96DRAFT_560674 [Choanephora cucurbitarum]
MYIFEGFSTFARKHKELILGWSVDIPANSMNGLHSAWFNRYSNIYVMIKKTKKRKRAIDVYHEEAIDTLTTAAAYVPPPDGDENELTQDDNNVNCNVSEDNNKATPILIHALSLSIFDEASFSNELLTSTPLSFTFHYDDIVISEGFCTMQQYGFNFVEASNLILESDLHLILSVYNKTNNRINAAASLLSLTDAVDNLIVFVSQILQFLPMDPTYSGICKTKPITRYILHAMEPSFDDYERDIRLEFTFIKLADNHNREVSFTGCFNNSIKSI